jgi:glycosyltransferase involved in cell wall biosynthesis
MRVVATTPSVEGMHLRPGVDALVADDAEAFAAAIERAYRDEALWSELAANGVANVRAHFSRDVARRALQQLFDLAAARELTVRAQA